MSRRKPDLLFVLVIIASLGVILSTRADERAERPVAAPAIAKSTATGAALPRSFHHSRQR